MVKIWYNKKLMFTSKQILALDLGTSAIKGLRFSREKNKIILKDFFIHEYSLTEREKGFKLQSLAPLLKEITAKKGLSRLPCITILKGPGVIMRKFTVPRMSKRELSSSLRLLLQKYVPFDLKNAFINYHPLDENNIFAVCIRRDEVETLKNIFAAADLLLKGISIAPLAYIHEGKGTIAVIDFGESFILISIFADRKLIFSRELSMGGKTLTRALSQTVSSDQAKISLSFNEAEKTKIEKGILLDHPALLALTRPILEKLSTEIKRTFDFFYEQIASSKTIEKIYLTGGSSQLKGLPQFLNEETKMKVEFLSPPENLSFDPAIDKNTFLKQFPYFSLALGMSSKEIEQINFARPPLGIQLFSFSFENFTKIAFAYGFFLVFLGIILLFSNLFLSFQENILKKRYTPFASLMAKFSDLKSIKNKIQDLHNNLPGLKTSLKIPFLWRDLSKNINPDIYLTHLHVSDAGLIIIKGLILNDNQEAKLSDLITFFKSQSYLKGAFLVSSAEDFSADEKGTAFEIEGYFQ